MDAPSALSLSLTHFHPLYLILSLLSLNVSLALSIPSLCSFAFISPSFSHLLFLVLSILLCSLSFSTCASSSSSSPLGFLLLLLLPKLPCLTSCHLVKAHHRHPYEANVLPLFFFLPVNLFCLISHVIFTSQGILYFDLAANRPVISIFITLNNCINLYGKIYILFVSQVSCHNIFNIIIVFICKMLKGKYIHF